MEKRNDMTEDNVLSGFHTLWTAPYFAQNKGDVFCMQDYELLTMILSALMWRKNNGPISLYGDKRAIAYVEEKGISHIWNGGLYDISVPDSVRANVFWASGKLYALKEVKAPSVMVDLDLIVWKSVREYVEGTEICAIHREGLYPDVYPGREFFRMKEGYEFDEDWSWNVYPVNTCMLYLADDGVKKYYVDSAIDFMENCVEKDDNLCHMVFAEQRLIAMCAEKKKVGISSFFPEAADIENQDVFTHLWGFKNILKYNFEKRVEFNNKLCNRILMDFPDEAAVLGELDIAR